MTLRAIVNDLELEEILYGEDKLAHRLCKRLEETIKPWGITIERAEVLDIARER